LTKIFKRTFIEMQYLIATKTWQSKSSYYITKFKCICLGK